MNDSSNGKMSSLLSSVRRLSRLYIDNARLTAAEKITLFLSAAAVSFIVLVFALAMSIFLAIGIANLLESVIPPYLSYLLIAALFAILIVLVICLRTRLIFDPIARFISRLILPAPDDKDNEEK